MSTAYNTGRAGGPAAKLTPTAAHIETVASSAINSSVSDVDGAVRRLSAAVQTALLRVERNRLGSRGGRL